MSYGPSAITHLLGFHPTTPLSANFINFSSIFRFSHMHAPDLVITTHPGLPSPSTIDWPNIPPTCWPQCHSLLHSPSFYQFLLISHPIHPSIRLSNTSTHLSTNSVWTPSVCLTQVHPHPPVWAWSTLTHLSVQALCLPLSICHHHWVTFTSVKDIVDIF